MGDLLTLARMARRVNVTQHWLREQAEVGNVPCLKTGKSRYLFNAAAVEEAIAEMAAEARQGSVANV